jgi:23S rRNA-/tRNA-specific pseudouridylate synthase
MEKSTPRNLLKIENNIGGTQKGGSPAAGKLLDVIIPFLNDAKILANGLIQIGAVYIDRVRELNPDALVPADAYVRVHTRPRRFPMVSKVDWNERMVHICDDFAVLNKPGGVPVHASTDNIIETCLAAVSRLVGGSVHPLHRLDVPTHGLLILGRTSQFNAHFCSMMRQRYVRKEYLALAYRAPPLGLMVHWMKPSERSPKEVDYESHGEGWQECRLIVKHVSIVPGAELSPAAHQLIASQSLPGAPSADHPPEQAPTPDAAATFEVRIELLTGRTHQIRAQLAKEGCHIIGDEMYCSGPGQSDDADGADDAGDGADDGGRGEDGVDQAKRLAREMEEGGTLALQAVLLQFPRLHAVPQGGDRPIGKAPYVKLSKRQRREARAREAEEHAQAALAGRPDAAEAEATAAAAAAEAYGPAGPAVYAEEDLLRFALPHPWWRVSPPADGAA